MGYLLLLFWIQLNTEEQYVARSRKAYFSSFRCCGDCNSIHFLSELVSDVIIGTIIASRQIDDLIDCMNVQQETIWEFSGSTDITIWESYNNSLYVSIENSNLLLD